MKRLQTPSKRAVSRGKYITLIGVQVGLGSCGWIATIFGGVTAVSGMTFGLDDLLRECGFSEATLPPHYVFWTACTLCFLFGLRCLFVCERMDAALISIAANTSCSPLSSNPLHDTLVRASQEPTQAQEGVLLRAATQTQDGHEEQLLRALAERQE